MDQLLTLAFPILMIAIIYFLMIRPQRKRQREHQELVYSVKRGDKIISAGGIHGVVKKVDKETVLLEVEDGTTLKMQKHSIAEKATAERTSGWADKEEKVQG